MFSQVSVHRALGVGTHPWMGMSGGGVSLTPLDTWDMGYYEIRSTSGRSASYWNAFLSVSVCLGLCVCLGFGQCERPTKDAWEQGYTFIVSQVVNNIVLEHRI